MSKVKKIKIIEQEKIVEQPKYVKYLVYGLLGVIVAFSFYVRGVIPAESVFRFGITAFASDDAVYHMRLVEHIIKFFPNWMDYDAFTRFPTGEFLTWGILFDYMIAIVSLIVGLGNPSQETINMVGAYFPAIMGALVSVPVFVILREVKGNITGLFGALLIAVMPGQFLSRSVLGFTDHHIAEVLWTTLTIMFLVLAIKRNSKWFSVGAGISLGAYLLTWTNGVFLVAVLGIFTIVQYVIDHLKNKKTDYLMNVMIVTFAIALLMVLPLVRLDNGISSWRYSLLHVMLLAGGVAAFFGYNKVSLWMNDKKMNKVLYPAMIVVSLMIIVGIVGTIVPDFYNNTVGSMNYIFKGNTEGRLTIAEASPITQAMLLGNFGNNYFYAFIGLAILGYWILRKGDAISTMLLVWSVFILQITYAQNRFAYYYAVNVVILTAIVGGTAINYVWKGVNSVSGVKVQHIGVIALVVGATMYFPIGTDMIKGVMEGTKYGAISEGYYEWYESLHWMRNNTPEPTLKFDNIYEQPAKGEAYEYSEGDYGVLSWWDYGHVITYWAQRMPNANPFQSGIGGGKGHEPGVATFLIANNEEDANKIADLLRAKYVISNAYMAYAIQPVFAEWDLSNIGYFTQIRQPQGMITIPTQKYYETMESRLHIFDGNGLKRYRLVHESSPAPWFRGASEEKGYKDLYNKAYGGSLKVEDSAYVKIFEYVKGAKIIGSGIGDVKISTDVRTNTGRTFVYEQSVKTDGRYEFVVPYSTTGWIDEGTQFDVIANTYTISYEDEIIRVDVDEKDILNGNTIEV